MKRASFFLLLAFSRLVSAQTKVDTVRIHVLNGHNGKAIRQADSLTTVLPEGTFADAIPTTTDRAGLETVYVPTTTSLRVVVKHHVTCDTVPRRERQFGARPASAETIMATGVVSGDGCGRGTLAPTPGELTLYVRASHWWQRLGY